MKELGLRAVATKPWRWMAGMKLLDRGNTYRLTYISGEYDEDKDESEEIKVMSAAVDGAPGWGWPSEGSGWAPDFSDPATFGCLLALVQETIPADTFCQIVTFMVEDSEWGSNSMIDLLIEALE